MQNKADHKRSYAGYLGRKAQEPPPPEPEPAPDAEG